MHSTLNALNSSNGGLLHSVSTVWTMGSLLEPEQDMDLCCVIVWPIAKLSLLL